MIGLSEDLLLEGASEVSRVVGAIVYACRGRVNLFFHLCDDILL